MKKNTKIILFTLFAAFSVCFGGLVYYVSTKINSEEIRKLTLKVLQEEFPQSEIELGQIDVSIGASVKLDIDKLSIVYPGKNNKYPLFSVKEIDVKIPILSILSGGGNIDVEIESPDIGFYQFKVKNNWTFAMEKKKGSSTKTAKKGPSAPAKKKKTEKQEVQGEAKSLAIPAFLIGSSVNIRLNDVKVTHKAYRAELNNLAFKTIKVKKLNLKTPTAFEIDSNISSIAKDGKKTGLHLLAIGQFNLKEILDSNTVKSVVEIRLNDFVLPEGNYNIPEIKTEVDVTVHPNGAVNGKVVAKFQSKNQVSLDFSSHKGTVNLSKILSELHLVDLLAISPDDVTAFDPNDSILNLKGGFRMSAKGKKHVDLNFSIDKPIIKEVDGEKFEILASGKISGKKVELNPKLKFWGGAANIDVKTDYDLNRPFDKNKLKPIYVDAKLSNIKIDKESIQSSLYPKKEEKKPEVAADPEAKGEDANSDSSPSKQKKETGPLIPPLNIKLLLDKIAIDNQDLDGEVELVTRKKYIETKKLLFEYSGGKANITHKTDILNPSSMNHKFDVNVSNFNLIGLSPLLPPSVSEIEGIFNGKVNGTAKSRGDKTSYLANANIKANSGKIKGYNIKEYIGGILEWLDKLSKGKISSKKDIPVNGDFDSIAFNGVLTDSKHKINKFEFIGKGQKIKATKGRGEVFPVGTRKSSVYFDLFIGSSGVQKFMEKNIGSKNAKFKLAGPGLSLKPDVGYIMKENAKSRAKKEVKKQKKKLIEKGKKKIEKLFKGKGSDKIKGLLKGFGL